MFQWYQSLSLAGQLDYMAWTKYYPSLVMSSMQAQGSVCTELIAGSGLMSVIHLIVCIPHAFLVCLSQLPMTAGQKEQNGAYFRFLTYMILTLDEEAKIDIGLPYYRPPRAKQLKERKEILKQNRQSVEMERASRLRTCMYPAVLVSSSSVSVVALTTLPRISLLLICNCSGDST